MLLDHGGVEGRTMSTVPEGSEPEGFWTALGGMGEYPEASEAEEVSQEPRLFQVTIALIYHIISCTCMHESPLCQPRFYCPQVTIASEKSGLHRAYFLLR